MEKGRLNIQGPAYGALLFDRQKTLPYEVVKKLLVYSKAGFPIIFLLQVEKGRLNIQGPAYGALLFDRQKTLPYEVVKKLLVYSKAGFPIIFLGEAPMEPSSQKEPQIREMMENLLEKDNVILLQTEEELPPVLKNAGVYSDMYLGTSSQKEPQIREMMENLLEKDNVILLQTEEELPPVLKNAGVYSDMYLGSTGKLLGVHRRWEENEIYWLGNLGDAAAYDEVDERRKICTEYRKIVGSAQKMGRK